MLIHAFIARCGWAGARVMPLAGDASNRRYLRLRRGSGEGAVLMDAPPGTGEDIRPFLSIAQHLRQAGLRAPHIIAADTRTGLMLLEDLGDALFARVLEAAPQQESTLYAAAVDVLVRLHAAPLPDGVAAYDAAAMADLGALAVDWYAPEAGPREPLQTALGDALARTASGVSVLVLRDYHAENLIWLGGEGSSAIGLLDFQDAMRGHPAYDLVSLLTDARRDVSPTVADRMTNRYIAATGQDRGAFLAACAALGAQRNLRILGVFARLCLRDGKQHYLSLLPRVWTHLQGCLAHPELARLRDAAASLPPPTPARLADLEARCGTLPRP
jgi:aminoglycoside/choline kinase family phosphotransferase